MAASEPAAQRRTYGNWRVPRSAGLGALGLIGTAVMMLGLLCVIVVTALAGIVAGLVLLVVLAAGLAPLVFRDRHGRTVLSRAAVRVGWWRRRSSGSHLYRSGPLGQSPWGTFQLPGLMAASSLSEGSDSYGRPFALLRVPATAHYTVVFATEPDGASLVDSEQVDAWVAHWGQWIASLGDEPGVVAVSVTVETAPDSGTRLRREIQANIDQAAPAVAQAMLGEVLESYPSGSATVQAWVAVTFAAASGVGARRRDAGEMARDLASRLPGLGTRLQSTGAGVARPLDAQGLCEVIRTAYDPAAARLFDDARANGTVPALCWSDVGPTASETRWECYRHDSAVSITWEMSVAPRGEVQASVLAALLLPHPGIARKRVTLLYQCMDAAQAARIVEADRRNADFRARASDRPSARVLRDHAAATRTAEEEARGAGLVDFGMLVTATVTGEQQLRDAAAVVDNLAAAARILLRPVYGSQDSAFAAALPFGLVLPRHLKVPAGMRAAL